MANITFGGTAGGNPTGQVMDQILALLGQKGFGQTTPYQNNIMQQQQQMFTNPLGSGIFQGLVGSVLNALKPQEAQAQQNLTDMFRSAGGASPLQSGAFAKQAQMLQGNILGQESNTISGLAQNSMGQLMQALQQGFNMGEPNRTAGQLTVTDLLNLVGHGVDLGNAQTKLQQGANAGTAQTPTQSSALQSLLQQLIGAQTNPAFNSSSSGAGGTGGIAGTPNRQQLIQALGSGGQGTYNPNPGPGLNSYGYPLDTYGGSGAYYDPNPQPQPDYWYAQNTNMGG